MRIPDLLSIIRLADGKLGLPALRFRKEPGTGIRRSGAGKMAFDILSALSAELSTAGLRALASGAASISPLTIQRISDPGSDGDETRFDIKNAAGTVLARLAIFRLISGSWGWKFYTSGGGVLSASPVLSMSGTAATFAGVITALATTVTGASPGTPAANTLYKESVVKAWGYINNAGTLVAGFNCTVGGFDFITGWPVTFSTAAATANYAVIATAYNNAYFVEVLLQTTAGFKLAVGPSGSGPSSGHGCFFVVFGV